MVHFSNIIRNHNEMRETIIKIEAMKKKIKPNNGSKTRQTSLT